MLEEESLISVRTDKAGIYKRIKILGESIERGDIIA